MIGAVLTASAFELGQLVVGRVVLGFGVGMSHMTSPFCTPSWAMFHQLCVILRDVSCKEGGLSLPRALVCILDNITGRQPIVRGHRPCTRA